MRAPWNLLGLRASQRPLSQEPTALLTFTWTFFAVGSAVPEHPLFKSRLRTAATALTTATPDV